MSIVTMVCEAKCKHCKHFKYVYPLKKDGTKSWIKRYFCGIPSISGRNYNLTIKDKVCDKWDLL